MSADLFAGALALVLTYEGGFVDDPGDPGGPTNLGITQSTLSEWRGRAVSLAEVRELRRQDVAPIYHSRYWTPVCGDALPAGVDLITFDGAVNQGAPRMVRLLQAALGVAVDGEAGSATLHAVALAHPADLIERLRLGRVRAYKADPGFGRFGAGWLRRVDSIAHTAQSWAAKAAA